MYSQVKEDFGQSVVLSTAGAEQLNPAPGIVNATNVSGSNGISVTSTQTLTSGDQRNPAHRGIKVYINVLNIATAGTLTVTIQGKDPISGVYYTLLVSTAIAVTGFTVLTVYPGVAVSANVSASDVLPATFRIQAVVGGTVTGTFTATIGGCLLI